MNNAQGPVPPRSILKEVLLVFGIVSAACLSLSLLALLVGWIRQNLLALFALLFLYAPFAVFRRRNLSPSDYAITTSAWT